MTQKVYGIIVAAGLGTRLGSSEPKALVPIGGKSILSHCIENLTRAVSFEKLTVTYPEGYEQQYRQVLNVSSGIELVLGGESRQQSVKNALDCISAEDSDLVLIHDAARCFVEEDSIARVMEVAKEFGAATLALPQTDSLKRSEKDSSIAQETVERADLWRIQTPQVFEFQHISKAHSLPDQTATDDASLVQELHPVRLVQGSEQNFKVTTKWDLKVAEALLSELV